MSLLFSLFWSSSILTNCCTMLSMPSKRLLSALVISRSLWSCAFSASSKSILSSNIFISGKMTPCSWWSPRGVCVAHDFSALFMNSYTTFFSFSTFFSGVLPLSWFGFLAWPSKTAIFSSKENFSLYIVSSFSCKSIILSLDSPSSNSSRTFSS